MDKLDIQRWDDLSPSQQREVAGLLDRVWPSSPSDATSVEPLHNPALQPVSLRMLRGSELVAYAAVLSQRVEVAGQVYLAQGLSCVACEPRLQGQGLGGRVVAEATAWMKNSGADFGIFSCDAELLPFYCHHGWVEAPGVLLCGSVDTAALNSADTGKRVLLRLWSTRTRARAADFGQACIVLGLPPGEFW
ncbi:GNAT family N-acetyltransferase [Aeromonas sp. MR7]|uniref:GNAT family N-acetyltransferase n=1 Tax=Aeromonas sp. MR7 TaxID=2923419 RepID=UPI001F4A30B7|nr:GNAT family N-acetyltransferase [Aeromonas sp. MR7]MCH7348813.1 GNAT family N-acetyltransferase [Aeromonas sp. MR7]